MLKKRPLLVFFFNGILVQRKKVKSVKKAREL
jgi:hypothetical protein